MFMKNEYTHDHYATFLCRDYRTAIVKICLVEGEENITKAKAILTAINEVFHYRFDKTTSDLQKDEFLRDMKLDDLLENFMKVPHTFLDAGFCDTWNTEGKNYIDCYWGFEAF